jgi:putative oxidoreductase
MQRLFSTFPNSWPGCGLLVLRLAAAATTLVSAFSAAPLSGLPRAVFQTIASAAGALLVAGLWTPVAGLLQVCVELTDGFDRAPVGISQILLSTLGIGLSMLGPGAWSLDARLFGRKQIWFIKS